MTNLIGIAGRISSGKDTAAKIIQWLTLKETETNIWNTYELYCKDVPIHRPMNTWQIKKFAGTLKQICSLLTGIPVADFEKQEVKDSYLGEEWNYSYRYNFENQLTRIPVGRGYKDDQLPIPFNKEINRMKVRELLQIVGTECLRDNLHENVHVNALFADYKPIYYGAVDPAGDNSNYQNFKIYPKWIISDMRFPNEFKAIKDRGGITIRVNRPNRHQEGIYINSNDKSSFEKAIADAAESNQDRINNSQFAHLSETALDNAEFDYIIDNNGTIKELIEQVRAILVEENII